MRKITLEDAQTDLAHLVDAVSKGEFVTIIRHGELVATLTPVAAGEIARRETERKRPGLVDYLKTFPGGEVERNPAPSR